MAPPDVSPIEVGSPAPGDDRRGPDPKALTLWRVRGVAITAVLVGSLLPLALSLLVVSGRAAVYGLVGLAALTVAALLVSFRMARVRYEYTSYVVGPDRLELRRGALFRTEMIVPYHRVQHIDVSAGPLEQFFGLRSLQLATAASSISSAVGGLSEPEAERVRDAVLARIGSGDAA